MDLAVVSDGDGHATAIQIPPWAAGAAGADVANDMMNGERDSAWLLIRTGTIASERFTISYRDGDVLVGG
jgi:hypothetical protein